MNDVRALSAVSGRTTYEAIRAALLTLCLGRLGDPAARFLGFLCRSALPLSPLLLVSLLAACGCRQERGPAPANYPEPAATTESASASAVAVNDHSGFFFALSPAARAQLLAALSRVPLGTDATGVVRALGVPTDDERQNAPFGERKHRRRVLSYLIAQRDEHYHEVRGNEQINLWFDWQGRLEIVQSSCADVQYRCTPDAMKGTLVKPYAFPPAVAETAHEYDGYWFALAPDKREKLARLVTAMSFGSEVNDVIRKLGPPDDDAEGGVPIVTAWPPRQHRRRCLTYTIARQANGLVTEGKDQYVDLWFDWRGKLEYVDSSCPAIQSRALDNAMDETPQPGMENAPPPGYLLKLSGAE